ncbi:hypothetical protein V2G26_007782 [Clonostachys chloroleuca]
MNRTTEAPRILPGGGGTTITFLRDDKSRETKRRIRLDRAVAQASNVLEGWLDVAIQGPAASFTLQWAMTKLFHSLSHERCQWQPLACLGQWREIVGACIAKNKERKELSKLNDMAFITSHLLPVFGSLPTAAVTHMPTHSILIVPPMDLDQMCRFVRDTGSFQGSAVFKAICLCFGEDKDNACMSSLLLVESHCIFKKLEIHMPPTPTPSFSNCHRLLYIRNYYYLWA